MPRIRLRCSLGRVFVPPYSARDCKGKGGPQEPVAQRTTLGWILFGAIGEAISGHLARTHQCRVEESLAVLVHRFWLQEEVPSTTGALSRQERECEEHYELTHSRKSNGRYIVRLPLIAPLPDLAGTRRVAVRVLKGMENKFTRDPSFRELYCDFMHQYTDLGHMTPALPVANSADQRVCYLPHHGVMREASSTTKLRVVFNGSATVATSESLNRHLHTGPNLLPVLADILLR